MPDPIAPKAGESEEKLGVVHEQLEGWIPSIATDGEIREAFEKAFDYRGDLTITLKDGNRLEGYVFDRRAESASLDECFVRMMPKDSPVKVSVRYSDIAGLAFTGRDSAAGKSFEAWVRKYKEKKALGEKNIGIESEALE